MYLLKLFHQSDPAHPIDTRVMGDGVTRIGRDPCADWFVPDEECEISRSHLELHLDGGCLRLKPLGTNGVYCGSSPQRLDCGADVPVGMGDRFRFGKYSLLVEPSPLPDAPLDAARTMIMAAPFGDTPAVPTEWIDAHDGDFEAGEDSLLAAFCEGANLDPSAFATEDPAEVMRRAGAAYRQMVLGLAALMNERSSVKTRYRLDRTTIGARDNNPFKWAPTQQLAIDLLLNGESDFLSGTAAIKASFEDLKKHLLCTLAGFRASLGAMLALTHPATIRGEARKEGFFQSRDSAAWNAFQRAHARLQQQMRQDGDGVLNSAFIKAYDQRMRELEKDRQN